MNDLKLTDLAVILYRTEDAIYFGWELSLPPSAVTGYQPNKLYRVKHYDAHTGTLHLKTDGNYPESDYEISFNDNTKILKGMDIRKISVRQNRFEALIDWSDLQEPSIPQVYPQPVTQSVREHEPVPPSNWVFQETVSFDLRDAVFEDGKVSFEAKLKSTSARVNIVIENPSIKKHFDSIKNYIWTLYGKRKTPCTATFDRVNEKIVVTSVDECSLQSLSTDILEQINDGWLEKHILDIASDDINIIGDLTAPLEDDTLNEHWVWNQLVKEEKTKHYHHLSYLSKRQAIDMQKLAITGKPISFVFVVAVNHKIFLVWETYLSQEATYIWELNDVSEIKSKYSLIQKLRKNTRMAYRREKEPGFHFVEHQYKEELNGFKKWKNEIDKILI
ncbi:hypothetical protein [Sediminibacterium ginsengisoli]|uniref:Uncharacterized protein n=1 Tax=Sediminibacterium ginsengisoli TaxID=413434 RepID=A0A1T4R4Q2_9BACT|nr:hypothetical protein [Sediminibacterium ginsengisoli]SKA10889.1 hypothetical protein SAMN04488132_110129 [Sediminibacterium ginsengisoli]